MARIEARKQARPAGGTNLTGGEMVGERHAILGDPVNIRCVGNRITVQPKASNRSWSVQMRTMFGVRVGASVMFVSVQRSEPKVIEQS